MKNLALSLLSFICLITLVGCDKITHTPEIINNCIVAGNCVTGGTIEDLSNKYFTAFGTEPFWDIEISGGIAHFASLMYDTDVTVPVTIWQEGDNYYFSGEELEGEFILKDCIDGGKGDMHYYTVGISKFREYYYEGCGDGEDGIKMPDEDVPEDFYQYEPEEDCQPVFYPLDHEVFPYADIMEEKIKNGFCNIESCMQSLDQYQPEWMPGDPQTQITVACGPIYYGETYITGYIYTSTHPDLGLRITSPKGYDTFYVKSETPIFVRKGDKISHGQEYIRVYEKSDDESLLEIIESNLNENCFAQSREYEGQNKIYGNIDNNIIYEIVDNEGNIWGNCTADNESKEQDYTLVRYFESLDKTKYYKLVFTDGCAPGPCSMFDEVEIF